MTDAVQQALLPLAGQEGWTWATLRAALAAAGEDPALVASHFPAGPVGAIATWSAQLDAEMAAAGTAEDLLAQRIPARIRWLVAKRLALLAPHKPALRRAAAHLALPWNLALAARLAAATADAMWRAAGDGSADFSWYTRRLTLGGIHTATLAFWCRDDAPETEAALAFLDRRLAENAKLQRLKRAA